MITAILLLTVILAAMDGLNNAANVLGWGLGGGLLTLRRALIIASLSQLIGGAAFGVHIINTISYELVVDLGLLDTVVTPLAVLISTIVWSAIASIIRIPISFSMAVTGGIIGAVTAYSTRYINWFVTLNIFGGWIAAFSASIIFTLILLKLNDRVGRLYGVDIWLGGVLVAVALASLITKSIHLYIEATPLHTLYIFTALYTVLYITLKRCRDASMALPLLLISMIHGANDSALIASILMLSEFRACCTHLSALISAVGMAVGTIIWGYRISSTLASSIVLLDLRYVGAIYTSEYISMAILLVLGLPTPVSLVAMGALIGFSMYRGLDSIRIDYASKMILVTLASTPACMLLSYAMVAGARLVMS